MSFENGSRRPPKDSVGELYLNFPGRKAQNQEITTGLCFLAKMLLLDKANMQRQECSSGD